MIYKGHTIKQVADTFVVLGREDQPDFDRLEDACTFIDTGWREEMGGYFVHKDYREAVYEDGVLDICGFEKAIESELEELDTIVARFIGDINLYFSRASYKPMKWAYRQEGWYQSGSWDLIRCYYHDGWSDRYRINNNGQYYHEFTMKYRPSGIEYVVEEFVPKLLTMECGAEFNGFVTKEGRRSWVRAICAIN